MDDCHTIWLDMHKTTGFDLNFLTQISKKNMNKEMLLKYF